MYPRCHFDATGLLAALQFEKHLGEDPRLSPSTDAQFLEAKNER